ncbi:hypothetical protein GCM10010964_14730 [Caldovatus sediminis]|uniref:Uncharacterized protein n=1 Tax=Caldovatus sediminis TaxID=2041189 RepID=A0A8J2ZAG2_9PROT|nr:hypothetical protein GCM10010964_14730 [Caldovatus sediminis]
MTPRAVAADDHQRLLWQARLRLADAGLGAGGPRHRRKRAETRKEQAMDKGKEVSAAEADRRHGSDL